MESCHAVQGRALDLVVHSPGGSATAAEQIVNYLRTQFDSIRVIVPLQAKSAATMIALGADEIVMGRFSELGPIDPQIFVPIPGGQGRFAPAHAILRDFKRAKDEITQDVNARCLRGCGRGSSPRCPVSSLLTLQKVLGHASLAMTMRYAHLSSDHLRAEMAKTERPVEPDDGTKEARGGEGEAKVLESTDERRGSSVAEQLIRNQ
jgi:hypothetical protein